MPTNNFARIGIGFTLKNFRQLISTFPKNVGSVAVMSERRIQTQLQRWSTLLPKVKPYYAVKCNPEPFLLNTLYKSGIGFDCASLREVHEVLAQNKAMKAETAPEILYAHPMKSDRDIRMVDSMGIRQTTVDSVEECFKLDSNSWNGSAILRVAVGDSESKMPFSTKFGASMDEVNIIAKRCRIPITGVSFHVGSGCDSAEQYRLAIKYCVKEVFPLLEISGHKPTILDIGGGFSSNMTEFIKVADVISKTIYQDVSNNISVIAEPGRYLAQPCQDLFVKIIAKKPGLNGKGWRYVIDESLYGQFSCIPFDQQQPAWIHIPSEEQIAIQEREESVIFGRTCDSLDMIAKGPMEYMEVGDWLYFPLMGAYTSATASEFNGFPKPATLVDNEHYLPDLDCAWNLHNQIHRLRPLRYANSLSAIT